LGWHDAGDPNILDKTRKMIERAEEYSNNHGADRINVFEQGCVRGSLDENEDPKIILIIFRYSQGWDARKEALTSKTPTN
jgi:hypothetical protein